MRSADRPFFLFFFLPRLDFIQIESASGTIPNQRERHASLLGPPPLLPVFRGASINAAAFAAMYFNRSVP